MNYWIYPAKGRAIIVKADTHAEAKEKISRCHDYDGGKIVVLNVEFYASLCETGALEVALFQAGI